MTQSSRLGQINYVWRFFTTNTSFFIFGVGAISMSVIAFPLIHAFAWVTSRGIEWARLRCQYIVHLGFRAFIWFMSISGVLTYEVRGRDKLEGIKGRVVVANHPTLLDIVFLISMVPHAYCVVKRSLWSNFFLAGVLRGVGYIPNGDPFQLIDNCVEALNSGHNLVIFPEATRTERGAEIKMKRGAASVISKTGCATMPVSITCSQPTLSKTEKWYIPSPNRMHFFIVVHDAYDPRQDIAETKRFSLSNRRINRHLKAAFVAGLVNNE